MKFDLSKVEFSRIDLKQKVKFPKELNPELAYLLGVHLGDGTMNHYGKYYYSFEYAGHLVDEYEFYTIYIRNLFFDLFNKKLRVYKCLREKRTCIRLCTQSKAIFTYLTGVIQLRAGPKTETPIPKIILNSDYICDFLRGFADADFCLTFKKGERDLHSYPVITLSTNNNILSNQLNDLLIKLGFKTSFIPNFPRKRYDRYYTSNQIDISGKKQLELWMKLIGFNSRKHLTKYLIWKKYGFCPSNTSLPERESMLKGELNPISYYNM